MSCLGLLDLRGKKERAVDVNDSEGKMGAHVKSHYSASLRDGERGIGQASSWALLFVSAVFKVRLVVKERGLVVWYG